MELKEIYNFTIYEEKEIPVETVSKDTEGNEVKVTKKEKVKTPVKVILKKPSRRQIEEADLEYSVEMSRCVKKGILTKAMLVKKYSDTGGLMSETEAKGLYQMYQRLMELQREYTENETVNKGEANRQKKTEELIFEMAKVRDQIVKTEMAYQSLFDHTADMKAQNRLLLWYIINLTFIQRENEDKPSPYFKGEDFEDKLEDYYVKEESEEIQYFEIARKISRIAAFWFYNQGATTQDYEALMEDKSEEAEPVETPEVAVEAEAEKSSPKKKTKKAS
jgi:hypothetical protein